MQNKPPTAGVSDDSKLFAFLAYLLGIIGFIIALVTKKDDKFVMFHAKQSLVLFLGAVAIGIVGAVLWIIPTIGYLITWILRVLWLVLWIMGMVNALSMKEAKLPVVGDIAEKFNF
jgi:uncharacterized membrane protein